MPTRSDFELAANQFLGAASQLGEIPAGVANATASEILQGGSLGKLVPERLASASQTITACQGLVQDAAAECRKRALVIAAYERQLEWYDRQMYTYGIELDRWHWEYDFWFYSDGSYPHPGPMPIPPPKPAPPPPWADVRRP